MSVISFPHPENPSDGSLEEQAMLMAAFQSAQSGSSWETGVTENGDPQWYLLGPEPEQACELCVSRIAGRYILENGEGHLLAAHRELRRVTLLIENASRKTGRAIVARIVLLWCTVRQVIHDRVEPVLAESEDLLAHFAPQLAMLA